MRALALGLWNIDRKLHEDAMIRVLVRGAAAA
jgi:hypothetical protein